VIKRIVFWAIVITFAVGLGAPAAHAVQQTVSVTVVGSPTPAPTETPSPTASPETCVQTRNESDQPEDTFRYKGMIRVLLAAGCAKPAEPHIELDIASTPQLLAFVDADANGGFHTTAQQLPASALPGPHEIVVKTELHTYRAPITVTGSPGGGVSSGAGIGGGSTRRGGPLPKTGDDIVRLVTVALALLAGGAVLILGSRARHRFGQSSA
jgi:LPXTG-motif cell wall-anchored protein